MKPCASIVLVVPFLWAERASAQCTTRVSVDSQGVAANWYSGASVVSRDGRTVVFESFAWNLTKQDRNNDYDLFVHDRASGETTCVSLTPGGIPGNGQSQGPSLSGDARLVAFTSTASDLVGSDTNGKSDVFVHDRSSGVTTLVSLGIGGVPANGDAFAVSISGDGRHVAFSSAASNLVAAAAGGWVNVFVRDLETGTNVLVTLGTGGEPANGPSNFPVISADGRYVAFASSASNLVPEDGDTWSDVFVRDLVTERTTLVSVGTGGLKGNYASDRPSISANGRRVAFVSAATNLHPLDTNSWVDAYWRDLATGTTELVSLDSAGALANGPSPTVDLSPDGGYALFTSLASNLSPLDTDTESDAFVRDLAGGTTQMASLKSDGTNASKWCGARSISEYGRAVTLSSPAKLVPEKVGDLTDVFVRDFHCDVTSYCTAKFNSQFCQPTLAAVGAPTLGGFENFRIRASWVLPQKSGLLVWGLAPDATPFAGGLACVAPPYVRTGARLADGDPALACSGTLEFAFPQSYMAAQGLSAGTAVYVQVWSRDPGFAPPDDVGLTDALRFVIGP